MNVTEFHSTFLGWLILRRSRTILDDPCVLEKDRQYDQENYVMRSIRQELP